MDGHELFEKRSKRERKREGEKVSRGGGGGSFLDPGPRIRPQCRGGGGQVPGGQGRGGRAALFPWGFSMTSGGHEFP